MNKIEDNNNSYAKLAFEKGYEKGWQSANKMIKQMNESVRKLIINDFKANLDLIRDQMYVEHVRKHKIKVAD